MGYTYIPHQQYDTNPIHPKVNTSPSMVPNMCKCPTKPRFLGECLILGGIDCQECGTVGVDKFDRLKYPISISNLGYPFKNSHWTVSKSFRDSNRSHFEIPPCTGFVGTHSWRVPCIRESCEFLQQALETPKEIKKTQVGKKQMHNYHGQQLVISLSISITISDDYNGQYKDSQWWWNDQKLYNPIFGPWQIWWETRKLGSQFFIAGGSTPRDVEAASNQIWLEHAGTSLRSTEMMRIYYEFPDWSFAWQEKIMEPSQLVGDLLWFS